VRQVVDFSLIFSRIGWALAGAAVFIDADRPEFRTHPSAQTLGLTRYGHGGQDITKHRDHMA